MYIQRLDHSKATDSSIVVRRDQTPQNHNSWHYHDELELIYIRKGKGTFFVGDCIQSFSDQFMVLIGSNSPHYWLFDDAYLAEQAVQQADIQVVHFKADFCGASFLSLPEAQPIKQLYKRAERAIVLSNEDEQLLSFFDNLAKQSLLSRLSSLLSTLSYLAERPSLSLLVSEDYTNPQQQDDYKRMNKILEHIRLHYKTKIQLEEVAQLAGMTPNSFCRYFKQKTGKSLIPFVNELRIAFACKMLTETDATIKQICFDCGFQNFVSFHKIFKSLTAATPLHYRDAARQASA